MFWTKSIRQLAIRAAKPVVGLRLFYIVVYIVYHEAVWYTLLLNQEFAVLYVQTDEVEH